MGIVLVARRAGSDSVEEVARMMVDLHADQLGGRFVHLLDRRRPSELDDEVLALDVPEIAQARAKSLEPASAITSRRLTHCVLRWPR
jgi:hypothetical protein